jgi:alcohol dehydrogenase
VVANIGVHRAPVTLHLEELWRRNVTITTGLVDTVTVPMLLRLTRDGRLHAGQFGTHQFALNQITDAYDLLVGPDRHSVVKVVLKR